MGLNRSCIFISLPEHFYFPSRGVSPSTVVGVLFIFSLLADKFPCFLLDAGAERDKLVDKEGVEETARFVDAEPPVFLPTAHDAMLDPEWRLAANALLQWLNAMDQAVKK